MSTLHTEHVDEGIYVISAAIGGTKDMTLPSELYALHQQKRWPVLVAAIQKRLGIDPVPIKVQVRKIDAMIAAYTYGDKAHPQAHMNHSVLQNGLRMTLSSIMVEYAHANVVIFAIAHKLARLYCDGQRVACLTHAEIDTIIQRVQYVRISQR